MFEGIDPVLRRPCRIDWSIVLGDSITYTPIACRHTFSVGASLSPVAMKSRRRTRGERFQPAHDRIGATRETLNACAIGSPSRALDYEGPWAQALLGSHHSNAIAPIATAHIASEMLSRIR
jgi:hypothetical protein